jgi:hypothetical protein
MHYANWSLRFKKRQDIPFFGSIQGGSGYFSPLPPQVFVKRQHPSSSPSDP